MALENSHETIEHAERLVELLGKGASRIKDRSDFVLNLLLLRYQVAAVRTFEEGFA